MPCFVENGKFTGVRLEGLMCSAMLLPCVRPATEIRQVTDAGKGDTIISHNTSTRILSPNKRINSDPKGWRLLSRLSAAR